MRKWRRRRRRRKRKRRNSKIRSKTGAVKEGRRRE